MSPRGPRQIDDKAAQIINEIIRRGNDAEIRRKGDGIIILEVKKIIKYSSHPIGGDGSHRG